MNRIQKLLKYLKEAEEIDLSIDDDDEDESIDLDSSETNNSIPSNTGLLDDSFDDDLIDELNKIYTPILITQQLEGDISSQIIEACGSENILTERNIIKFDKDSRLAQLVSIASLLIARKKNTEAFQAYVTAAKIKKDAKLRIQQEEHAQAVALANKYLNRVAANGTSSTARDAANELQ